MALHLLLKFAIDSIQAELEGRSAPGAFYSDGLVGDLTLYAAIIAALGLLQWLVAVGMRWYLTGSSRWVERDIRQIYVNHLLKLSLDFFQRQKVGDLMARSSSDVEAIRESAVSIMPKGLDKILSPGQLADLIAFLRSCRAGAVTKTTTR